MFTAQAAGVLQPLRGQYQSRYGVVEYETYAFIPHPLGEEYPVLSQQIFGAVSRASMALARLSELGEGIPNPRLLRQPTMRREAQSTSALEGTFERLETVLAQEYTPGDKKTGWNTSLIEVFNYLDAADYGISCMVEGRHISLQLIRELQQILITNTRSDNKQAGDIRVSQVFIGSPTKRIEDARFIPMPPGQELELQLRSLIDWWGTRTEPGLAVLDMALFHHQFETLHPFTDGNGRIGRLLILLQMMQRKLLTQPLLSVSPWFELRRPEYQDRLLHVSTHGDWGNWILFFCQGIEESCEAALTRVKQLNRLSDEYRRRIIEHGYGRTALDTAQLLIAQPYMTVSAAVQHLHKSPTAVRNALQHLQLLGIVRASKHGNTITYIADAVVRAISDNSI